MNTMELSARIDSCATLWEVAGAVAVFEEGTCYHKNFYGLADRENELLITQESTYLLSYNSRFLMGLCIGVLIDLNKLSLGDTLDKFIPEYPHASNITLKQLCLKQSGLPDFFNGGIMKIQQADAAHSALSDEERNLADRNLFTLPWTFADAISYVSDKKLTCIPGSEPADGLDNMSETVFIKEVIERTSGQHLPDYVRSVIFAPLGIGGEYSLVNTLPYAISNKITFVKSEYNVAENDTFAMNYADAEKLLLAILEKKLISPKAWKVITAPATFEQSIAFDAVSGFLLARDVCYGNLGWSCYLYVDWNAKLGLLHLTNSELIVRCGKGDRVSQFRREFREEVAAAFVYPKNTKLVPYSKINARDAIGLSIDTKQLEYMCQAQQAICIAYAYKQKLFILMEGKRSVGLVAFSVNRKKEKYYIESVLIDHNYQKRGFGKIMMEEGLAYLRTQGCKYLTIGVHRNNIAAQALYKAIGFQDKTIYEDFIEMEAWL